MRMLWMYPYPFPLPRSGRGDDGKHNESLRKWRSEANRLDSCASWLLSRRAVIARHGVLLALLFGLCIPCSSVWAHPEGFSGVHFTIDANRMRAAITVHTRDLDHWFPPQRFPDYIADVTREMEKSVDDIVEVQLDGQPLPVDNVRAFLVEVGLIEIDVDFKLPAAADTVELLIWSKHLIHLPRGHQQLLHVEDRREIAPDAEHGVIRLEDVLGDERDAAAILLPTIHATGSRPVPVAAADEDDAAENFADHKTNRVEDLDDAADDRDADSTSSAQRTPKVGTVAGQSSSRISFFWFGVRHILTGYDHLLFLAALLLACTTLREAAAIITCFTLAHSITLALAALDIVRIPASMVEPAIALTIVYVAIENLVHTPVLWQRAAITCSFGLVHGLGFASALREIGLGTLPGGVFLPLLTFNLGVEAGQLCVAACCFPVLAFARKQKARGSILVTAGSALIALFGGYWFVSRVVSMFLSGP
jgi:hydrogenase/urease accessory protein HupE